MPTSKPEKKEPKKPLSITHPELAKEADGWDPKDFKSGSHEKLQWKCFNGHVFERRVRSHVEIKRCPVCRKGEVFAKETSLTNPKFKAILRDLRLVAI